MRRILLLTAICSLLIAFGVDAAPGLGLRWDACLADGGLTNKDFACFTRSGSDVLVLSFVPPPVVDSVRAIEFTLDIISPWGFSPWWAFGGTYGCRPGGLGITVEPTRFPSRCSGAFVDGCSASLLSYTYDATGSWRTRIQGRVLREVTPPFSASAGDHSEMLLAALYVNRTDPRGACYGCQYPACLGLTQLKLVGSSEARSAYLYDEIVPGSSTVTWQSDIVGSTLTPGPTPATTYRTIQCSLAVPAQNHTWGSIKSLYH